MSKQNQCCPPAAFLGLGQPGPPFGGGRASGRPVLGQVSPVPGTASLSVAFPVPPNWAPERGDEAMGPSEGNSQASRGWVSQAFVCKLLTPGLSAKSACPSLPRRASVQLYFLPSKGIGEGHAGRSTLSLSLSLLCLNFHHCPLAIIPRKSC